MSVPASFSQTITRINRIATTSGMVGLLILISLIIVEVVSRKLFNYSTKISVEMSGYLMVLISYMGMGYALRQGSHIQVKFVVSHLSQRLRDWLPFAWCVTGLGFVILLAFRNLELMLTSFELHSVSVGQFPIPLWPIQGVVFLGLSLMAFQFLAELLGLKRT